MINIPNNDTFNQIATIEKAITNEIEDGLMKNITYNRLLLNKENFEKTNIRSIFISYIEVEIILSGNDKNYLIDSDKRQGKCRLGDFPVLLATFESMEAIKEIDITL